MKGTYTIPSFSNCGLLTPMINLMIPGLGNTADAHFTFPKGQLTAPSTV